VGRGGTGEGGDLLFHFADLTESISTSHTDNRSLEKPMTAPDLEQKKAREEQELRIRQQIAFASGLFQGDVTIRTVLESLAEGVVVIDKSGTILLVNNHAEQMFGYPKDDLIGKPHAVLIPERYRKVHEEHEAHFFKEPMIRPMGELLDLFGLRRDGSEFPLEISLSFMETSIGVLALAFVSDITLRKKYETRLQEKEELFRIQVEHVKDYAIFMLDPKGNVLTWNAGAECMKGYRSEEIIGKHFSSFYSEEDRSAGKPEEVLKIAAAEGQAEDEGWRVRKDGSSFWADVTITALRDESGNLRGFSKVTRDTTGRKKAEEELTKYREHLEELVHERTDQLEQARLVAEAANRAKSEFLTNMSHEMRTPLTGISGVIDLLLTNGLTDQQRHFLNMAKRSADSLTQLINNILDFSRIEAGKISLVMQPFDLRDCIRAATDIFTMDVDRKGLRFSLEIDDGVPEMVVGDAGRLRLVLVNLLANAVKFTEHGEIDVSVRPAPDPARPGQDVLLFTVRDTGIGISASYLENIFEKFTQAEELLSKKYGGAGLGLALTKRIVENMGGKIRVESRPGEGSVFFFTIPFARPA
jgi:PAS domain S-box-containing protein